ncbi:MAG: hypothetical protein ACNA71_06565 [Kiritimatiellia bacterium]
MANEFVEEKDRTAKQSGSDDFLDLNFVPQWARRPPDAVHAARFRDHDADRSDGRGRRGARDGGGDRRSYGKRGGGDEGRRPKRDRRTDGAERDMAPPARRREEVSGPSGSRPEDRPSRHDSRPPSREYAREPLPTFLHAQFLPERQAVFALRKRVASTHKAYPLLDLAAFLLSREGMCFVRLDITQSEEGRALYQCQICRTVALDRDAIAAHIAQDHVADYFVEETETVPPPAGVFVCVAICGLSGKLLGPPNHHSYAEAVKSVHEQQYAHMSLEQYRSKIRVSHEAADVERWKESCTTRTIYRRKSSDTEEPGEVLALKDVQQFMADEVVAKNIKSLRRVVLQEAEAHAVQDAVIRRVLHRAWQHELQFPIQVALALRAALRSRDLHVFKAGGGKGMHFVTAVKPHALDPELAIPVIRDALRYLAEHPGCTRAEMIHDLLGEVAEDDPRVKELLQPISWLTERGHIIEFFNGRLAVPRG